MPRTRREKIRNEDQPITLCRSDPTMEHAVKRYAEAIRANAPLIGDHGMAPPEFWASGLFRAAIEHIRGQQAANMQEKRDFVANILAFLKASGHIDDWAYVGNADRHDYEVRLGGRIAALETKGCLDGNNTNIFVRPPNADEFIIWSLCQNTGADPRYNAWSGIHTRLSAEMMHRRERVDGLVIWDMVCGTLGRLCPKLDTAPQRATTVAGRSVPPPCIYLFPRTIPDPRSNPQPPCWSIREIRFLDALHAAFNGDDEDVTEVKITADVEAATVRRTVRLSRAGRVIICSPPTPINRAHA